MNHLFLHCRPGFEKECAAEINDRATALGIYGYGKTQPHSAWVLFVTQEPDGASRLLEKLRFQELIFIRQWFACLPMLADLPTDDRITSIVCAAQQLPECAELVIETVDTNDGKALSNLGRKLSKALTAALRKHKQLRQASVGGDRRRMHLMLLGGTDVFLGYSPESNSAAWPMGIPRLRLSREAPSRATLKLEEAWHHFIPRDQWDERLAGGMRAVDLGAAPGGWTWQLVRRGMFVDAVDNGPMQDALMESGQVTHRQTDGYVFEPRKNVRWMVCDIADKPLRTAELISRWLGRRWCREAVFNLKLPMKQRYGEVLKCAERIEAAMVEAGIKVELRFKQLYHDREEVTGHIRVID